MRCLMQQKRLLEPVGGSGRDCNCIGGKGESSFGVYPPTIIATIAPVQALTLTSYSLPLVETMLTDHTGGLSVFSRTEESTVPPPTAARASVCAVALLMKVQGAIEASG